MRIRAQRIAILIGFIAFIVVSNRVGVIEGQRKNTPGEGFAAVPGLKGGHDVFGRTTRSRTGRDRWGRVFPTTTGGPGRSRPTCTRRVPIACW
jgi:hypothetical protein